MAQVFLLEELPWHMAGPEKDTAGDIEVFTVVVAETCKTIQNDTDAVNKRTLLSRNVQSLLSGTNVRWLWDGMKCERPAHRFLQN